MKNREQKQKDLEALAEQFKNAGAAMLVSFKNMTVAKDQELRRQLRVPALAASTFQHEFAGEKLRPHGRDPTQKLLRIAFVVMAEVLP